MIYPSTNDLVRLLAGSALLGVCFCLAYDLLRVIRVLTGIDGTLSFRLALPVPPKMHLHLVPHPGWNGLLINFGDILFFLCCGVTLAVYLSAANHGRLRWPVLAGLGGGFLLCRMTLSVIVFRCAGVLAEILRFLLAWALWFVCRPICLFLHLCHRAGCLVGNAVIFLWLPLYTLWKMRRCIGRLRQFYHRKRRMHNGAP
ncbi:MAG: spore cortex biosynthesis protein YabQ [Clostridia bacterium]|nr:spore cortex biosynthesis protein YabQ [Clostridia bacterium]